MKPKSIEETVLETIKKTFNDKFPTKTDAKKQPQKQTVVEKVAEKGKALLEGVIKIPKVFILKTEKLSNKTKEVHYKLYKDHLEAANRLEVELLSVNLENHKENQEMIHGVKHNQTEHLNSAILHELYFSNISSPTSELHLDTVAYMRLSRDWGSFDKWQMDFIACCMAAKEGWAICYLNPYLNKYVNCVVDGDSVGLPVGGIPVIVMDMHAHSYFYDYMDDKKSYVYNMMKELNWDVLEGRFVVAERANLHQLYQIMPPQMTEAEKMMPNTPQNQPPIPTGQLISSPPNDQDQSTTPKKDAL